MTAYYNEIDPYAAEWIRAASDGVYSSGYAGHNVGRRATYYKRRGS